MLNGEGTPGLPGPVAMPPRCPAAGLDLGKNVDRFKDVEVGDTQ